MFEVCRSERAAVASEYVVLSAIVTVALVVVVGALSLAIIGNVDAAANLVN